MTEELIARLEKATGADADLDIEIFKLIEVPKSAAGTIFEFMIDHVGDPLWRCAHPPQSVGSWWHMDRPTASIDAALTLVPEGHFWTVSGGIDDVGAPRGMEGMFSACCPSEPVSFERRVWAKHPAIALCIAALKARNSEDGQDASAD